MSGDMTEKDIAHELAKCITNRDRYSNKSVLDERIESAIRQIAGQIVNDVVASNTQLHVVIREHANIAITNALKSDTFLSDIVASAIGKALGQYVKGKEDDDEN